LFTKEEQTLSNRYHLESLLKN